ncbi:MAG: efflux RND transporter periplasmic adaptor subunit [Treponema sp.]|nr:efflux RND transporter periplasmic adaptor subunit [Treponema sp.]
MKLYPDTDLPLSQEYFFNKKPVTQQRIIIIISALLLFALLWTIFAPFEEVVKCTGYIRPKDNISPVSNAVTGRIEGIYYRTGQHVKKGQLLIKIDPTQLESEKESLIKQMEKETLDLKGLYEIKKSIETNKNIISEENKKASLRYDAWITNLNRLKNIQDLNKEMYLREKTLPSSMTTKSRLNELETQYLVSKDEYENLNISFRHDITAEIETLEISKKMNDAKLQQIENSLLYTSIRAPIDGIIQEISSYNKSDWIQSGQKLFNIVPDNLQNIRIELNIPAKKAGRITEALKVKMRFPSLPYYEFNGAEGLILTIDPDITQTQNSEAFFRIISSIDKSELTSKKGITYPLKPGLQVDARIIISQKTVFLFILEKMNLWY